MADSYSWLNLSMRLRFCAGATKVHKIILVAINASIEYLLARYRTAIQRGVVKRS